jgi:hypothetical protein
MVYCDGPNVDVWNIFSKTNKVDNTLKTDLWEDLPCNAKGMEI